MSARTQQLREFVGTTVDGGGSTAQAFVGTGAGITLLPYSQGLRINNAGDLLVINGPLLQSFIVSGGTATPTVLEASNLNDLDQVVGSFFSSVELPFITTTSGITNIANPTNFIITFMFLNDNGVVTGIAADGTISTAGYIWDPVDGTLLLSSVVPAGWTITEASGINNSGQIVAQGSFMGGAKLSALAPTVALFVASTSLDAPGERGQ